jgi:Zn-finger protein
MLTQKCLHKEWLLVKIKGLRGVKIWQCKQCKLLLKEKTKGFHEVFILKSPAQLLNVPQMKVHSSSSKAKESDFHLSELGKTLLTATVDTAHDIQLKK